ncbi:hypothetical protein AURDEDRAFT_179871 [Auricularia subglabra TFB-10046 SS5]|nr:hypothetical protein AURDEDRAFT_179871 [Auricularia subglabra TFB-10046 SS5]
MSALPDDTFHNNGVVTLYTTIALLCQTFFFGAFAVLMPFSAYIVKKRGHHTRFRWLIYCTLFMLLLSTAYWIASVASLVIHVHSYFISPSLSLQNKDNVFSSLRSAVILINYVITDGVVVWRAWVLCRSDNGRLLYLPLLFLCLTSISVAATIVIRIAITVIRANNGYGPGPSNLNHAIDITQVANLTLTLITNIIATTLIANKAWKHRRLVRDHLKDAENRGHRAESVLALVVESGVLYCLSNVTMLAATLIRLPYGTLGDIYTPVNVQIAGIYPTIVLLIVGLQMTIQDAAPGVAPDESVMEFARTHLGARSESVTVRLDMQSVEYSTSARHRDLWTSRVPRLKTIHLHVLVGSMTD